MAIRSGVFSCVAWRSFLLHGSNCLRLTKPPRLQQPQLPFAVLRKILTPLGHSAFAASKERGQLLAVAGQVFCVFGFHSTDFNRLKSGMQLPKLVVDEDCLDG